MTKIKICGLTDLRGVEAVNAAGPEYIGFVFAPSRRRVTYAQAQSLRRALRPGITPVGVFANAPMAEVLALAGQGVIAAIQLHGAEDAAYVRTLKTRTAAPIIQANGGLSSPADFLLFDGPVPGSGQAFDWAAVSEVTRPFFLAGGLHAGNVAAAIRAAAPFAVDVSSGVETDGAKDPEKIQEFIRRVRDGA